jgi:hypothetical protein
MTDMTTVDSEIDEAERGIKQVESFIDWSKNQLKAYEQMPESEFRATYMGQLYVSLSRYGDEIDKLKKQRSKLWNYRFHKGETWKCSNCGTTNSPFRHTCDNCI